MHYIVCSSPTTTKVHYFIVSWGKSTITRTLFQKHVEYLARTSPSQSLPLYIPRSSEEVAYLWPLLRWRKQCRWPPAASRRWSSWWWIRKSCNTDITRRPVKTFRVYIVHGQRRWGSTADKWSTSAEAVTFWFVCGRYPLWFWGPNRTMLRRSVIFLSPSSKFHDRISK